MILAGEVVAIEREYPLHVRALRRHAAWAHDFAAVSEIEAAHAELLDIAAIAAELRRDRSEPRDVLR